MSHLGGRHVTSERACSPCLRDHIITSDWLAAHDAEVRRETGERIAQAIEAEARRGSRNPGLRDAARIAREEASRGSGYCPDACTWPHDHRPERDGIPWPTRGEASCG